MEIQNDFSGYKSSWVWNQYECPEVYWFSEVINRIGIFPPALVRHILAVLSMDPLSRTGIIIIR